MNSPDSTTAVVDPKVLGLQPRPANFSAHARGSWAAISGKLSSARCRAYAVKAPLLCAAAKEREDLANRKRH